MALVTIYSHGDELQVEAPSGERSGFILSVSDQDEWGGRAIIITRAQARYLAVKLLAYLDETEQNPVAAAGAHAEGVP